MGIIKGLICKICAERYEEAAQYVCEECFGPLAVDYDYDRISSSVKGGEFFTQEANTQGDSAFPPSLQWIVPGLRTGGTPLVRAHRLGRILGINNLYLKDEGASYPTLSFKDRVVASAMTKVKEFGFQTVACASTGNLANALAARAACCGIRCVIFIPRGSDYGRISHAISSGAILFEVQSNYDGANRLCSEVQDALGWAVVNGNLKPYYLEGAKGIAYEIMHELRDDRPAAIVAPMGGGGLLSMLWTGLCEMRDLGFIKGELPSLIGAQASGSAPIVHAWQKGSLEVTPVKPDTDIDAIAIGNPPDGSYAIDAMRKSGGSGFSIPDEEAWEMMKLLAKEEGIATGGAGGVALCAAYRMIKSDAASNKRPVVVLLTDRGDAGDMLDNSKKERSEYARKVESDFSSFIELWNRDYA